MHDSSPSRREFIAAASLAAASTALGADTPATPPMDSPRELLPTGADMGTLYADVLKIADVNQYSNSFASGKFKTNEEFQAVARAKLFEVLNWKPEKVDPKVEVIERVERDDHIREKVIFSTTPQFRVPAYVLIPKNLKKPAPAIVDLHSHGGMFLFGKEKVIDLGNNHPTMTTYHQRNYEGRPTATALVSRGYVVISIDAFMFGERRAMSDAQANLGWDRSKYTVADVQTLNQYCRSRESTITKSLIFAGASWPGIVFWDDIRTVDYLVSRPEVDPDRIGCLGVSMGGYRTIYLAALDQRIKAACIAGFMSTVRPMLKSHIETHSFVHFLADVHRYLDLPDVASLTAPRNLMVLQCKKDGLFPPQGMKDSVDKIESVYAKAGVKDNFAGRFYDLPHIFNKEMQDDAFAFLDRRLKDGVKQ